MALTRKEYSDMMKYLTRPKQVSVKKPYDEEMRIGTDEIINEPKNTFSYTPTLSPDTQPVMPEVIQIADPKLAQIELAEGGTPKQSLVDAAVQESYFNPKKIASDVGKSSRGISQYIKTITKTPAARMLGAEIGFGLPFVPYDYTEGYSPEDIALNAATLGMGTSIKDEVNMMKAIGKEKSLLLLEHAAKKTARAGNKLRGIESIIDKKTQEALDAKDAFYQKLQEQRDKVKQQREEKTVDTWYDLYKDRSKIRQGRG